MTATSFSPSPRIIARPRPEPEYRGRVRRIARYGIFAITYDCEVSAREGESNRDVIYASLESGVSSIDRAVPCKMVFDSLNELRLNNNMTWDELITSAKRENEDEDSPTYGLTA